MAKAYYVIQVRTRAEDKFLRLAAPTAQAMNVRLFWPRRNLRIRRRGRWRNVVTPVFPGYVFVEGDSVEPQLYWRLKRLPGFLRFLKDNENIVALPQRDARILTNLMQFGEVVEKSKAYFDENHRIRIVAGPLKGLEGCIKKVDRRKGRAKIRLDLYEESYLVDFAFTMIESARKDSEETAT